MKRKSFTNIPTYEKLQKTSCENLLTFLIGLWWSFLPGFSHAGSRSSDEFGAFSVRWASSGRKWRAVRLHIRRLEKISKPVTADDKLQQRAGGDTLAASHGPPERALKSPDPFTAGYVSILLNPYLSIARSRRSHPSTGSTLTFTPTSCKVAYSEFEDLGVILYLFLYFPPNGLLWAELQHASVCINNK